MIQYLQGFTMGLAFLAPIGLQNLFVINTALTQKKGRVFATALFVIFFDVALAFSCFYGVGAIMLASPLLEMAILLIGSVLVIVIGIRLILSKGETNGPANTNMTIPQVVSTAFAVTWLNPQALIDGSMMLGAFKAVLPPHQAIKFILGVTTASCTWFLSLSAVVSLFSTRFTPKVLRVINIICGIVILFYGVKLGLDFIRMLPV